MYYMLQVDLIPVPPINPMFKCITYYYAPHAIVQHMLLHAVLFTCDTVPRTITVIHVITHLFYI